MQYDLVNTKNRIKDYKFLENRIISMEYELLDLETKIQKCTSDPTAFNFGGGDFNYIEEKIAKYSDKKNELEIEIDKAKREYSLITRAFETLTKNERIVIEEYYFKERSFKFISVDILPYSERQIANILTASLIKFYKNGIN